MNPLLTTNINRFVGFGTHSGTPTTTQPITDGVGFEWDGVNSKLWASIWVGGTRSTSSVDISSRATSGNTRYGIQWRSDIAVFYGCNN